MLVVRTSLDDLESYDFCILQTPVSKVDPLYVRACGTVAAHVLARALEFDGYVSRPTARLLEALLAEKGEVTLPLAAALSPEGWLQLVALSGWVQEETPSKRMFLPPWAPNLALPALVSLSQWAREKEREVRVLLEADGINLKLVTLAGIGLEVALVYRFSPPQDALAAEKLLLSKRATSLRLVSEMRLTRGWGDELVAAVAPDYTVKTEGATITTEYCEQPVRAPIYRNRRLDLLGPAFSEDSEKVYNVLNELHVGGGTAEESAFREWLESAGLSEDHYLKLVLYGYVRRVAAPGTVSVTITEKGLYAVRLYEKEKEKERGEGPS